MPSIAENIAEKFYCLKTTPEMVPPYEEGVGLNFDKMVPSGGSEERFILYLRRDVKGDEAIKLLSELGFDTETASSPISEKGAVLEFNKSQIPSDHTK